MTRDEIITLVLSRCGKAEDVAYLVTAAGNELVVIQQELETGPFLPWFLQVEALVELAAGASEANYTDHDEADIIREVDALPMYLDLGEDEGGVYLPRKETPGFCLEAIAETTEAGHPQHYARYGEYGGSSSVIFDRAADADYTLYQGLLVKQPALSASVQENAWTRNAAPLLVGKLGAVMAGIYKNDPARAAMFDREAGRAHANLFALDESKKQASLEAYRDDLPRRPS